MGELTDRELWESQYRARLHRDDRGTAEGFSKRIVKAVFGKKIFKYTASFEEHILWDIIYRRFIPGGEGGKALEIGSAPGRTLVRLHQVFGFVPYGVEYSESGVELNRSLFVENGIDPGNVILADFFSDDFQGKYRGYFDLVVSNGFVEHFTDVGPVIEKHLNLLVDGGCLIVNVPNMRGFSCGLVWVFGRERLAMHNLEIMRVERFRRLFPENRLVPLFCGYAGTFNVTLPPSISEGSSWACGATKSLHGVFMSLINVVMHVLFKDRGAESRFFSPNLTFIGLKKGCPALKTLG